MKIALISIAVMFLLYTLKWFGGLSSILFMLFLLLIGKAISEIRISNAAIKALRDAKEAQLKS